MMWKNKTLEDLTAERHEKIVECFTADKPKYQIKYKGEILCKAVNPETESAICPYHMGSVVAGQLMKIDRRLVFLRKKCVIYYMCGRGKR